MFIKDALISFEFCRIKDLKYDPDIDGFQPVVHKAFKKLKQCVASSILAKFDEIAESKFFKADQCLHIATACARQGALILLMTTKFYYFPPSLDPEQQQPQQQQHQGSTSSPASAPARSPAAMYKVVLELEQTSLADSSIVLNNDKLQSLVKLLKASFEAGERVECLPLLKRGRLDVPHYLISSDERVLEYDFEKVLFHKKSQFQDVKIISSPSLGNTLLLDNLQNLSEADLSYTNALMHKGRISYKDKNVLILGGGDGGLLYELLKEEPAFVTMAEIDPVVIDACREHLKPCGQALESLRGKNYEILIEDCLKTLRHSVAQGISYDVILNDLTDIPVSPVKPSSDSEDFMMAAAAAGDPLVPKKNPWHFIEAIYNLSLECLKDDGHYMNHATGKGNTAAIEAYEEFLKRSRIKVSYSRRSHFVPSFKEIWVFYSVWKRGRQGRKSGD